MVCEHCGEEILPGAKYCNNCLAPVPVQSYDQLVPAYSAVPAITPGNVLTWGIVAAACAFTFIASFLGIIFGVKALRKADSYLAVYGPGSTQVKVGHILGKVGIIAGIIMTVLFVLYVIFFVIVIALNV